MVETRSKTKADLATTEAERVQRERSELSPRGARPAPATTTDGTLAVSADSVLPSVHSEQPHSERSRSSRSSRSSATIRAQRLALEADAKRRQVERERELARLQAERERQQAALQRERELELARLETEAEQTELQAKLATLEASDKSDKSRSSYFSNHVSEKRTVTWVSQQNANMTSGAHVNLPGEAPTATLDNTQGRLSQPAAAANAASFYAPDVDRATCSKPTHAIYNYETVGQRQAIEHSSSDISKLAHAINYLSNRPKRPELVTFSGDADQWMSFKSSYERTKSNFTPSENIERLNNAVRGPAYQSVASLLWTSAAPDDVVRTLEQTYARPELLVAREVTELRNSPKLSSPEDLNRLANKLRNFMTTLRLLKQNEYLSSPELFQSILTKLSEHTRARFTDFGSAYVSVEQNLTKLELLSRFLLTEADQQLKFNFVVDGIATGKVQSLNPVRYQFKKENVHAIGSNDKPPERCMFCKQGLHKLRVCKSFLSLTVDDRWRWVRETKLCYRCLKSNPHTWNTCNAKRCGVDGCSRRHNALLHGTAPAGPKASATPGGSCNNTLEFFVDPTNSVGTSKAEDKTEPPVKITNTSDSLINATGSRPSGSRLRGLLKVVPIVLEGPDGDFATTALLDEGSTVTLIDGDVAARIGARPTCRERLRIEGVSGMTKEVDVSYVDFYVRGRNSAKRYRVKHARAIKPLGLRVQNPETINFTEYGHLAELSDELSHTDASPTVLIGAPDWYLSLSREVRSGKRNEPVASRTLLGWVLHGALSVSSKPLDFVNHVSDDSLDGLIKSQYDIDALGILKNVPRPNDDDKRAVDIIEASARQLDNGHFEVGLPWKKDLPMIIPDSYPQALSRFQALERQMSKDPDFATAFQRFISDIVSKGYAEECDPSTYHNRPALGTSCITPDGSIRWYLPIFGVYHPQKKKLRVVHDAAAATKGVSLNSMLLQGPDLLCSLIDILFRFREGTVALNGDIKEMFPQVKISPRDREAQRFLWRTDGHLKEYRMSSMIFGAVSSPFMALYIKNKNAKRMEADYPAACMAIIDDHYMDDYPGSHSSAADAAQLAADVITVHKACGYEMRSWTSNDPKALVLVPRDLRSDATSDIYLPPSSEVGVLGVKWNPRQDSLGFRVIPQTTNNSLTKRSLLSNVMKVYDPLGLLMPVVIWGRILVQRLWRAGIGWDEDLSDTYRSECEDWFEQLGIASSIKIPRCYSSRTDVSDIQLHVVADGGEQAYACVAYWRFCYSDGSVSTALIGSKARVSPLKPVSIPRLELQAALIASRIAQTILKAHRIKPSETIFWTDSTTVLKWIRSDARSFKPFVAHRLGELLETTNPSNWRWIPTSLNVADDATKPKKLNLTYSHRWFTGPEFLLQPPHAWPTECVSDAEEAPPDLESKSDLVVLLLETASSSSLVPNPSRFSCWLRLLRATARVLQGARLFRLKLSRPIAPNSKLFIDDTTSAFQLQAADIVEAEQMILRHAQMESFPEELAALRTSQLVPRNSRIAKLAPTLCQDGLMRLDTRIRSAPGVDENQKAPVILDGRNHVTRLLIQHEHIRTSHGFDELVLNELRQRYWMLRARGSIKSVASACQRCRRCKGRTIQPQTGNLPLERLDHHKRPFTHVGIDYFGPITVTIHRRTEKRYVALYTCLVARALHLEMVNSLSSDAAIMSLRRFIARRGSPTTIFSDNGTNFVGASRELRCLHDDAVKEYATNHKIEWRFIPPASPFMGGAWERLVRTVKTALRSCLPNGPLKEDVLATLLLEAEAIVNSRPLTYVSSSPEAPEAITPFHFILGSSSIAPWTATLTDADLSRRCDWRRALRLADHFWARWLKEYLPTLRPRGLARNASNVSEGDVVLVADPNLPRGLWPLGRVVKTYPGPDGAVRVADIRTKGGVLRRPARKLVLMDTTAQPVATSC